MTEIEDADLLSCPKPVREAEVCHVRPSGRAVNREEPKARGRNVVKLCVRVRHQLIRLLGCRVERHRMIDLIVCRIRNLRVGSVNARAGRVDKMPDAGISCRRTVIRMPARLENIVKADQIGPDIGIRMRNRIPHARLRREVHNNVRFALRKSARYKLLIRDISPDKRKVRIRRQPGQPLFFNCDIIIIVHIVDAGYADARIFRQKPRAKRAPDKPCRAGNKNTGALQINILFNHLYSFQSSVPLRLPLSGCRLQPTYFKPPRFTKAF